MLPDEHTIAESMLKVGSGHEIYLQDWGNKNAKKPILFLHGGPGSGCTDKHKKFFDPKVQRVIFFDQRGCGKSTPYGELKHNTTEDLVADIIKILDFCSVKKVTIVGGSWGSTLALAFTIKHQERVDTLVLGGIFTARQAEVDFLEQGGFRAFFPEAWERFVASVPKEFHKNPRDYHLPRVLGKDLAAAKVSAYEYLLLEGSVMSLDDRKKFDDFKAFDPIPTTIECYYIANKCFMPEGYILEHAKNIKCPVYIVQGRYDAVCPPYTAYELHQQFPNSKLQWTTAGHSGSDRNNWEVVRAVVASIT